MRPMQQAMPSEKAPGLSDTALGLRLAPDTFWRPSLDAVLDSLGTPVAILNEDGRIIATNATWRQLARVCRQKSLIGSVGDNYLTLCEAAGRSVPGSAMMRKRLGRMLTGRLSLFERICTLRGDRRMRLQMRFQRVESSLPLRLIVSVRDVTELTEAQRTARYLNQRVIDAEMNEYQRFASELHDSVSQSIVSLNLNLSRLGMLTDHSDQITDILGEMRSAIDQVHAQIRTVSYLLQPPWPEEAGTFDKVVPQFVEGFARRAGLEVDMHAQGGPCTIDSERQFALFRILQEALVNVHRHAHASTVTVELTNNATDVVLRVRDDGHGICGGGDTDFKPGAGLLGMRARLRQFGGTLKIETGPAGTCLTANLPARAEKHAWPSYGSEQAKLAAPKPAARRKALAAVRKASPRVPLLNRSESNG